MGLPEIRAPRQQALEEPYGAGAHASIGALGERLAAAARDEVIGQGIAASAVTLHLSAHLRYAGTDTALAVDAGTPAAPASLAEMKSACEAAHMARFGFVDPSKALVVEAISVEAVGGSAKFAEPALPPAAQPLPAPQRMTQFHSGGRQHEAAIYTRRQLA